MMLELLNTFSEGSGYDEALKKVYGFDMEGLDTSWRDYVNTKYQSAAANKNSHPVFTWLREVPGELLSGSGLAFEYQRCS